MPREECIRQNDPQKSICLGLFTYPTKDIQRRSAIIKSWIFWAMILDPTKDIIVIQSPLEEWLNILNPANIFAGFEIKINILAKRQKTDPGSQRGHLKKYFQKIEEATNFLFIISDDRRVSVSTETLKNKKKSWYENIYGIRETILYTYKPGHIASPQCYRNATSGRKGNSPEVPVQIIIMDYNTLTEIEFFPGMLFEDYAVALLNDVPWQTISELARFGPHSGGKTQSLCRSNRLYTRQQAQDITRLVLALREKGYLVIKKDSVSLKLPGKSVIFGHDNGFSSHLKVVAAILKNLEIAEKKITEEGDRRSKRSSVSAKQEEAEQKRILYNNGILEFNRSMLHLYNDLLKVFHPENRNTKTRKRKNDHITGNNESVIYPRKSKKPRGRL